MCTPYVSSVHTHNTCKAHLFKCDHNTSVFFRPECYQLFFQGSFTTLVDAIFSYFRNVVARCATVVHWFDFIALHRFFHFDLIDGEGEVGFSVN